MRPLTCPPTDERLFGRLQEKCFPSPIPAERIGGALPAVTKTAHQRIYAMVDSIPKGSVATYGQIASEAGLPGRARQVGRALRELPGGSLLTDTPTTEEIR